MRLTILCALVGTETLAAGGVQRALLAHSRLPVSRSGLMIRS